MLVFAQLFNCFNSRSERRSALAGLHEGPLLWAAVLVSASCRCCVALASVLLWVDELEKLVAGGLRRARAAA